MNFMQHINKLRKNLDGLYLNIPYNIYQGKGQAYMIYSTSRSGLKSEEHTKSRENN